MRAPLKAGVLQFFNWPDTRIPLEQVYERAFSRIATMDETGYDAVWLAEHHFNRYSVCPSVHMMGMHIASRTKNLRIGTAVSLAAFYHPLRLAEEVALLDVLSGGRVNWGAGRGFDAVEFEAFGVPREESHERFREAVEVVLTAWRNERFSFDGAHHHFRDVELLPKPLQRPHPPVWMAATSEGSVAWAASKGFSILMDPHSSHAEIGRKRELYREALEAAGHSIEGRDLPMARLIAIADSEEEAFEVAKRGAAWTLGSYVNETNLGPPGLAFGGKAGEDPVQRYLDDVIVYGTPERVADKLAELRETMFLDYLLCSPLSHASFLLFTDKVLPKLG